MTPGARRNLLAAVERVIDEHDAASRALRDRFSDSQAATAARCRALVERRYAAPDESDRREPAREQWAPRPRDAADQDWAGRTGYPSDADAEEFPMPKSWLV